MKSILSVILILISLTVGYTQTTDRLSIIETQLENLVETNKGLASELDANITLNEVTLSNFLLAISNVHQVSISVAPELNQMRVTNNFSNVTVANVLLFLCKEYNLTIEFTGDILSIKPFIPVLEDQTHPIAIDFNPSNEMISIDTKQNSLYEVFKKIMDESAKNLLYAPRMENHLITSYIKTTSFDAAMDKLALSNNLTLTKTKDDFYVFDLILDNQNEGSKRNLRRRLNPNLGFKVIDSTQQLLEVNFENAKISEVIKSIGDSLKLNIFLASPLEQAGLVTIKTEAITFDNLLIKMFEPQIKLKSKNTDNSTTSSSSNKNSNGQDDKSKSSIYTFKKEGNIYFFGTTNQLSVRKVEIITLNHRSVNLMPDPESALNNNNFGNNFNTSNQSFGNQQNYNGSNTNFNRNQNNTNQNSPNIPQDQRSILDIIPEEIKHDLDFKVDFELNNIYVTGTSAKIEFFKSFVKQIDKTIPVILIEVMIVEASTSNKLEAGVTWGIGDEPQATQGGLFPTTDLTLGAQTINKIINGFSSTSVFNFGRVVPNFFATIKAMETNGDLKIKSTPKLATLNGHKASFSNGQTSYYAIVRRDIIGSDNPLSTEIRNYFPIDAKLGLDIKPYVTGDKQVLLDINVIQSTFGTRIADDAPPDINSRNFSSVVRMKDQDIAVLGGLEENYKSNSGSGVPFLARIPIIKWLFSKRVREARKSKLTVFIKPTVIY